MRTSFALLLALATTTAFADRQAIDVAVTHPDRLPSDIERDAGRQPAKVLEFFGLAPGQHVLDVFAGGGYYTELVARVVGSEGHVCSHNNTAYVNFARADLDAHFGEGRLSEVRQMTAEWDELDFPKGSFDVVLLILGYHDVYYRPEDGSWRAIDGPQFLAQIHHALRPGGVLGIVDHVAAAGSPAEVGHSLHRIDPDRARREIEAAGFVFDGELEALRNNRDDLTKPMYDETVRGKTDRFVYRFRKPT